MPVPGQLPICNVLARPCEAPWMKSSFLHPTPACPKSRCYFSLQPTPPEPTTLHYPALGKPITSHWDCPSQPPPPVKEPGVGGPQSLSLRLPLPGEALLVLVYPPLHHHWLQQTQLTATSGTLRGLFPWKTPPQPRVSHTCPALVQCHFLSDATFSRSHLLKEAPLPRPSLRSNSSRAHGMAPGAGVSLLFTVLAQAE